MCFLGATHFFGFNKEPKGHQLFCDAAIVETNPHFNSPFRCHSAHKGWRYLEGSLEFFFRIRGVLLAYFSAALLILYDGWVDKVTC